MKLLTEVAQPGPFVTLEPESHVVLSGSCFAEHIGRRLAEALPEGHVCGCPRGVLYNPASLLAEAEGLLTDGDSGRRWFEGSEGMWHDWDYASAYSAPSRAALAAMLAEREAAAKAVWQRAALWVVTFSTDHAYFLRHAVAGDVDALPVANCHKQPSALFEERVLPYGQMEQQWGGLLERLRQTRPGLKVVFTLSPYRYAKYGLHENQLSKARLLLLIDSLCGRYADVAAYFPAYEIVHDELRDYRFYAPDMLHPSEQAVDYVWERFCRWAFSERLSAYAREKAAIVRDAAHRMLHPDSPAAQAFRSAARERRRAFETKWGSL